MKNKLKSAIAIALVCVAAAAFSACGAATPANSSTVTFYGAGH